MIQVPSKYLPIGVDFNVSNSFSSTNGLIFEYCSLSSSNIHAAKRLIGASDLESDSAISSTFSSSFNKRSLYIICRVFNLYVIIFSLTSFS